MHRLISKSRLAIVLAAAAALLVTASPATAQKGKVDKGKDAKTADKPTPAGETPMTKDPIKLVPEGAKWGSQREDLEKMVDKFIDDDFRPKYKDAGKSAPRIKDLDTEVATKKASFRRTWIDLVAGPTGLDSSPLLGEYSKGNNEAVMNYHRGPGVKIWFFFINGRLWKTYEEVSLVDGGLYGKDIGAAAKILVDGVGGTMPRSTPANPDKKMYYDVVDWQDSVTHMRVFDRSGVLAVVREEKSTVANLGNLRKNTGPGKETIDPSVAAVLRGGSDDAPPKDDKKVDAAKDKKKKLRVSCFEP